MAIREIVRLGHPALRTAARPLQPEELAEEEVQSLVDDLVDTMRAAGGVGLAAPQVGVELQLFVYEANPSRPGGDKPTPRRSEPGRELAELIPLRVVANPMLELHARELDYDWEGCLSIPGLRGLVPRNLVVGVRGLDRQGQSVEYEAEGYEARIVQHEYDHLNGIVFLDRMRDLRSLCFVEEWERLVAAGGSREEIPSVG
jgi:peptide deformylase